MWTHESVVTRGPAAEWVAFMSYNIPQTRPICTGCYGGLTNRSCVEPKLLSSGARAGLSDWDPTYMSWAPAGGARSTAAWSQPVLVGAPAPQMDTNFAAVIDKGGRLVGMWRDHYRDAAGTKAKSTIHLVTAGDWRDNRTYALDHGDLLLSGRVDPGGVEDPFLVRDISDYSERSVSTAAPRDPRPWRSTSTPRGTTTRSSTSSSRTAAPRTRCAAPANSWGGTPSHPPATAATGRSLAWRTTAMSPTPTAATRSD